MKALVLDIFLGKEYIFLSFFRLFSFFFPLKTVFVHYSPGSFKLMQLIFSWLLFSYSKKTITIKRQLEKKSGEVCSLDFLFCMQITYIMGIHKQWTQGLPDGILIYIFKTQVKSYKTFYTGEIKCIGYLATAT